MKIPFLITAAGLIVILSSMQLSAQKQDYMITNMGDTIKCKIKLPIMFGAPLYKTHNMHGWQRILFDNINEYYITSDNFPRRKVLKTDGKAVFMKVLENGKISLYEESTINTNTAPGPDGLPTTDISTALYAAKLPNLNRVSKNIDVGSFGLSFKSKRKRILELSAMMLDNKTVAEKFVAENKFNLRSVRNIIHLYNSEESL